MTMNLHTSACCIQIHTYRRCLGQASRWLSLRVSWHWRWWTRIHRLQHKT